MRNVEFTPEELEVLRDVLKHHITDMDVEVGRTDTRDFKQLLKHRRDVLERALEKISQFAPA